jgi:penicillin-binding protein 1A
VFGVFPTNEDPKSDVIWEAFQPQTESIRTPHSTFGDPYSGQYQQLWQQAAQAARQAQESPKQEPSPRQGQRGNAPVATEPKPAPAPGSLPTQNTL